MELAFVRGVGCCAVDGEELRFASLRVVEVAYVVVSVEGARAVDVEARARVCVECLGWRLCREFVHVHVDLWHVGWRPDVVASACRELLRDGGAPGGGVGLLCERLLL